MTALDIYAACNNLLQGKYGTDIPIYGREVVDGYKTPSFFTEIDTDGLQIESVNNAYFEPIYTITYFQTSVDEIDQMTKLAEITALFGLGIKVGDRVVKVASIDTDYIGERNNVLEISINFRTVFIDISVEDTTEIADTLSVTENYII